MFFACAVRRNYARSRKKRLAAPLRRRLLKSFDDDAGLSGRTCWFEIPPRTRLRYSSADEWANCRQQQGLCCCAKSEIGPEAQLRSSPKSKSKLEKTTVSSPRRAAFCAFYRHLKLGAFKPVVSGTPKTVSLRGRRPAVKKPLHRPRTVIVRVLPLLVLNDGRGTASTGAQELAQGPSP